MLDRYAILHTDDFELTRYVHERVNLTREPPPRRKRRASIRALANQYDHEDFQLYYFSFSDDMSLKIDADNSHHRLALPVALGPQKSIRLFDREGRLGSRNTQMTLTLPAQA